MPAPDSLASFASPQAQLERSFREVIESNSLPVTQAKMDFFIQKDLENPRREAANRRLKAIADSIINQSAA